MHDFDDSNYLRLCAGGVLLFFIYVLLLVAKVCHVELAVAGVQRFIDYFLIGISFFLSLPILLECVLFLGYVLFYFFYAPGLIGGFLLFLASLFVLVAKLPAPMIHHELLLPWGCSMRFLGYVVAGFVLIRLFLSGFCAYKIKTSNFLDCHDLLISFSCLIRPLCFFGLYVCAYHFWSGMSPSPACIVWSYFFFFLYLCLEGLICVFSFLKYLLGAPSFPEDEQIVTDKRE